MEEVLVEIGQLAVQQSDGGAEVDAVVVPVTVVAVHPGQGMVRDQGGGRDHPGDHGGRQRGAEHGDGSAGHRDIMPGLSSRRGATAV